MSDSTGFIKMCMAAPLAYRLDRPIREDKLQLVSVGAGRAQIAVRLGTT